MRCKVLAYAKISTHTLTWSVTTHFTPQLSIPKISTHTLTWSVTLCYMAAVLSDLYFNSHAHVERDDETVTTGGNGIISTHTLTWSVTKPLKKYNLFMNISTHTLTWSVTSTGDFDK